MLPAGLILIAARTSRPCHFATASAVIGEAAKYTAKQI